VAGGKERLWPVFERLPQFFFACLPQSQEDSNPLPGRESRDGSPEPQGSPEASPKPDGSPEPDGESPKPVKSPSPTSKYPFTLTSNAFYRGPDLLEVKVRGMLGNLPWNLSKLKLGDLGPQRFWPGAGPPEGLAAGAARAPAKVSGESGES
jgi:hypothetical protein